jgi:hypothetical protein
MTEFGTLKSGPLHPNTSAQLVKLVTLTEAQKLSKEQIVEDSKMAARGRKQKACLLK